MALPPAPVRVPSQRRLTPSVTSVANDKGDKDSRAVHRSPGRCLTAEKKTGKPQLEDGLMKAVRPVIASNGVPCSK